MFKIILSLLLVSLNSWGSAGRVLSPDSLKSSDQTKTWTMPSISDTLDGIADAVTLTNKTINGSNNTITNISLTTGVTGALPVANGGTNNASLAATAGGTLYTDGTKVVNVGAGSSGQFLKSNGASAPTWASPSVTQSQETPTGTINGSNVTFTLANTPSTAASVLVFLDGVLQTLTTEYTRSTTTITFVTAPATGQSIVVQYSY